MAFKKKMALAIGCGMVMSVFAPLSVFAETVENTEGNLLATTEIADYVNIRSSASEDSERVGVLLPGHVVKVDGVEGEWSRVSSGDVSGYIRSDLLVTGQKAEETVLDQAGGQVTASRLNVRGGASLEADIVGSLAEGTRVTLAGEENGWYLIDYSGSRAYVSAEYIELDELSRLAMTLDQYEAYQAGGDQARAESGEGGSRYQASPDELTLLAALIECEAGGESREGMVAVGACVLNRVESGSFPGTISEVVYQSGQFTPAYSGALDMVLARGARSDCYEAAQAALDGENPIGGLLFFHAGGGEGLTIGNQTFY